LRGSIMNLTPNYQALAYEVLARSKAALTAGDPHEWRFYSSGHYQLFTALLEIDDSVFRKEIADIALPRADKLKVRVSEIILFKGELNVKRK